MSRSTLHTGHFMRKLRLYNCEHKGFLMENRFSILHLKRYLRIHRLSSQITTVIRNDELTIVYPVELRIYSGPHDMD